MTPKDKAYDLWQKMYVRLMPEFIIHNPDGERGGIRLRSAAKDCTLMMVEQLITTTSNIWDEMDMPVVYEQIQYWEAVKVELNKMNQ